MSGFRWRSRSRSSCTIIRRLNCEKPLWMLNVVMCRVGADTVEISEAGRTPRWQITKVGASLQHERLVLQAIQLTGEQHEAAGQRQQRGEREAVAVERRAEP